MHRATRIEVGRGSGYTRAGTALAVALGHSLGPRRLSSWRTANASRGACPALGSQERLGIDGAATLRIWDGTEWQSFCLLLLRKRYDNHDLQEVPDRHKGDFGIEAYSHDGCVFQCYAAEEPLGVKDLYEAQRDKLTTDLGKLRTNAGELSHLLGDLVIRTYVFMVPRQDSARLVQHATRKAEEVRSWDLPFISEDFRIVVVTDDYYAQERSSVFAIPTPLVEVSSVADEHVAIWRADNESLASTAADKLRAVGIEEDALDNYLSSLLAEYLEGENALQRLREKFPDVWQQLSLVKSTKERRLAIQHPPTNQADLSIVKAVVQELAGEMLREAPSIGDALAEGIAWSAVADWLMRCPLNLVNAP